MTLSYVFFLISNVKKNIYLPIDLTVPRLSLYSIDMRREKTFAWLIQLGTTHMAPLGGATRRVEKYLVDVIRP